MVKKIRVISKSGNFNTVLHTNGETLNNVMKALRGRGSYDKEVRGEAIEVPFEEIQYIAWETESE